MKIQYLLNNINLTKKDKKDIEEKLEKLSRFSDKILQTKVDLTYRPTRVKEEAVRLEVNLTLPHKLLRAVVRASDYKNAIDEVEKKLKRQLRKYKTFGEAKKRLTQKKIREIKRKNHS
jgi:ribosomal subunit interface protein